METQKKILSPMTAAILANMKPMKLGEIQVTKSRFGGFSAVPRNVDTVHEMCAYLRSAISESRMKYKDIARKAGCCTATVSNLASGTTKDPRFNTCVNILRALGHKLLAVHE